MEVNTMIELGTVQKELIESATEDFTENDIPIEEFETRVEEYHAAGEDLPNKIHNYDLVRFIENHAHRNVPDLTEEFMLFGVGFHREDDWFVQSDSALHETEE